MIDINLLKSGIEELGLKVSNKQLSLMDLYAEALIEKNKVMNLTRVTDPTAMVSDLFIDSLTPLLIRKKEKDFNTILDIGTGGGFPGVPLAIMCPESKVVMLDSTRKKINFVAETCEKLSLSNVDFIVGRGEREAHNNIYRESFNCVCARAVSDMKVLSEIAIPFVKPGGLFIALKSANVKDEIQKAENTIKNMGGALEEIKEITVPISNIPRILVIVKKISKTYKKYPREYGEIIKK